MSAAVMSFPSTPTLGRWLPSRGPGEMMLAVSGRRERLGPATSRSRRKTGSRTAGWGAVDQRIGRYVTAGSRDGTA